MVSFERDGEKREGLLHIRDFPPLTLVTSTEASDARDVYRGVPDVRGLPERHQEEGLKAAGD